jgi:hypothetical protein
LNAVQKALAAGGPSKHSLWLYHFPSHPMAGVSMVQPTPLFPGKPQPDHNIYHCKYCKELRVAQDFQQPADKRTPIMITLFCLSYIPFGYYVVTGNEYALVAWMTLLAIVAVI